MPKHWTSRDVPCESRVPTLSLSSQFPVMSLVRTLKDEQEARDAIMRATAIQGM